jgi:protein TonB
MDETSSPIGLSRTAVSPRSSERATSLFRGRLARLFPGRLARPSNALGLFVLGSFFAHGVAYGALSGLPDAEGDHGPLPAQELTFTVLAEQPEEPVAEPVIAPAPPPPRAPRRLAVEPTPTPAAAPVEEDSPPPIQTLGTSTESGLAVAGTVGAATPIAGTSLTGIQGGTGSGPALAPAPSRVDLRKLTSEWATLVSQAINKRASREYPRSALRARLEGSVLLNVRVGTQGRLEAVDVARSSGHPQLDEAALAAARAVVEVPAPPEAIHRYLKPFPVPVNYVIR